jgi:hypothetical protein
MKVRLAVQIFSPPVTAALRYIAHHGGRRIRLFQGLFCNGEIYGK